MPRYDPFNQPSPAVGIERLAKFLENPFEDEFGDPPQPLPLPIATVSTIMALTEVIPELNPDEDRQEVADQAAWVLGDIFGEKLHEWPFGGEILDPKQARELALWVVQFALERPPLNQSPEFQDMLQNPLMAELVSGVRSVGAGKGWQAKVKVQCEPQFRGNRMRENYQFGERRFEYADQETKERLSPYIKDIGLIGGNFLEIISFVCAPSNLYAKGLAEDSYLLDDMIEGAGEIADSLFEVGHIAIIMPYLFALAAPDTLRDGFKAVPKGGISSEIVDYVLAFDTKVRSCLAIQIQPELGDMDLSGLPIVDGEAGDVMPTDWPDIGSSELDVEPEV